jgi:NAD(P)-dependent dehydrogenase (short-subunit alcohol dehydrogenase family)
MITGGRTRRTAIVTGSGSGLGRALAVRLARDGWEIALCDIDTAAAAETLALVEHAGGVGRVERLDVGRPAEWEGLRERLGRDWPRLDLLVNNAGVAVSGEVGRCPLDDWRWIVDANLWGTIHGCHACVDWLKANPDRPHIVNVASLAAIGAAPGMAAYNVTKAGIVALSETLWTELRPHGVGVTVLCPSFFRTALLDRGRFAEDRHRRVAAAVADRSSLSAERVADAAVRAVARRQLYVFLPGRARLVWWFKRLFPLGFLAAVVSEVDRRFQADARSGAARGHRKDGAP